MKDDHLEPDVSSKAMVAEDDSGRNPDADLVKSSAQNPQTKHDRRDPDHPYYDKAAEDILGENPYADLSL